MSHLSRSATGMVCAAVLVLGAAPALAATAPPLASVYSDGGSGGSMPGMDDGSMPGMDHGSGDAASKGGASGAASSGGHESRPGLTHAGGTAATAAASRPRTAVLAGFATVNGAVMAVAFVVRRRTAGRGRTWMQRPATAGS
jgi:uncharacterized protein involved in copper resistance